MSPSDNASRNFRFRVKWRGRYVAGFPEVTPLPVKMKRAGQLQSGYPRPAIGPEGQSTPYFINLERGVAFDRGFEQWISMVCCYGPATGKGSLLPEYKNPLTIEVYAPGGEMEYSYHLSHCWVTEYKAFQNPDAGSHETAIEHLRLGFDTWNRDPSEDK
ncbi:phage tail protein [Methanoregula sp.]|uniref:phage tail protein n=1 Tax=Methanoregula sp. TaxID=2052170 RepID=UPI003C78412C